MADSEVYDTQEGAEIVQLKGRVSALEDEVASLKGALGELQMQFRNFVLSHAQEKSASSERREERSEEEATTHKEEETQRDMQAAPTTGLFFLSFSFRLQRDLGGGDSPFKVSDTLEQRINKIKLH